MYFWKRGTLHKYLCEVFVWFVKQIMNSLRKYARILQLLHKPEFTIGWSSLIDVFWRRDFSSVCSLTVRPNHVSRKTINSYHIMKQLNDVTVTHASAQTTFKSSWKINNLKGGHVFRGKSLSNLPFICPIHCAAKALTSIKMKRP